MQNYLRDAEIALREIGDVEVEVDPARIFCDERLEGLQGARARHLFGLARLMQELPASEGAQTTLSQIQAHRDDGEEVCGWPRYLHPYRMGE